MISKIAATKPNAPTYTPFSSIHVFGGPARRVRVTGCDISKKGDVLEKESDMRRWRNKNAL